MFNGISSITSTLSQGVIHDLRPILICLAAAIIVYYLPWGDYVRISIFAILIFVFCKFKFDGRVFIGFAISLLLITGYLTYLRADSIDKVAVTAFWFLVAGIICLLIEYIQNKRYDLKTAT